MNGFSKGILLLNTGSGPAFFIEQAFKLNMDRLSKLTGAPIGALLFWPFRGQARSHRGIARFEYCGSGLTCEEAGTGNGQFLSWQSSCRLAWVMLLSAGTLRVSQTLPPMVEPLPMVIRPKIVAPA